VEDLCTNAVLVLALHPLFGFSIGQRTQYQFVRLINAGVRLKTYKTAVSLDF
jgi:hypothetical protein